MKKLLGALFALLAIGPAIAQTPITPAIAAMVCANNTVVPTPVNGQFFYVQCDSSGKLITSGGGGGGSGTVTSVSVTTANGVSGTVANPTTTPAISLTLGAITPTTVNGNTFTTGTGTLTLGSVTLNAGAGGTLGSNAFTSTAYAPIASPTFTGTVTMPDASTFGTNFSVAGNAKLTSPAASTLQFGAADAAAPVAQTIQAQSVVAGTSNTAGVDWTFGASKGTGTGAGGKIVFQTAAAGTTGSTQNTLATAAAFGFGTVASPSVQVGPVAGNGLYNASGGTNGFGFTAGGNSWGGVDASNSVIMAALGVGFGWGTGAWGSTVDVKLGRMAAATLGLVNSANAQTLQIYGTSDANFGAPTNYERISITKAIGGAATIDVQNGGTGAAATQFAIKLAGTTKLDYGIGVGGGWTSSVPFTSITLATSGGGASLSVSGYAQSTQGWFTTSKSGIFSATDGDLQLVNFAGTSFTKLQFGGTTSSFPALVRSGATLQARLADNSADTGLTSGNFTASGASVIFNGLATDAAATDTTLCSRSSDGTVLKGSGTLGICLGTSSIRYKSRVHDIAVGLPEIMALPAKSFYLDAQHGDPNKQMYGFTAEDCAKVLPTLTGLDADARPNTCDYLGVVPVLVRAVQQQQVQIEKLKLAQRN